nr:MAG TPA: hypothetical protein [Microviridae sp.]
MHANTRARPNPWGPIHIPPVAINLISPIPIGVSASGFLRRRIQSNTKPTIAASAYPNAAPTVAVYGPIGQKGDQVTINAPISNSGHKYASGIMRRRRSATDMRHAHHNARANNTIKKICQNIFFPLAFRIGTVIELYHKSITRVDIK